MRQQPKFKRTKSSRHIRASIRVSKTKKKKNQSQQDANRILFPISFCSENVSKIHQGLGALLALCTQILKVRRLFHCKLKSDAAEWASRFSFNHLSSWISSWISIHVTLECYQDADSKRKSEIPGSDSWEVKISFSEFFCFSYSFITLIYVLI